MIEKFTFDIQLKKIRKKMILVKGQVENREHIVLKLLAYILYYDERLQVEVDAGYHYKPDLVILEDSREPQLWIDCGHVAPVKIENIARKLRRSRIVILKQTEAELRQFKKLMEKRVEDMARLEFLAFEPGFITRVAEALGRSNQVTLYPISENAIGLAMNDEIFESNLYR